MSDHLKINLVPVYNVFLLKTQIYYHRIWFDLYSNIARKSLPISIFDASLNVYSTLIKFQFPILKCMLNQSFFLSYLQLKFTGACMCMCVI